jgi:hypothetical protein
METAAGRGRPTSRTELIKTGLGTEGSGVPVVPIAGQGQPSASITTLFSPEPWGVSSVVQ